MTRYRLDDVVTARSVAVIGASQDPRRIGGRPIAFLRAAGYRGAVHPVNAKYAEAQGLPCAPTLAAISGPVDVAIIAVPARDVLPAVEACGAKGVKAAIVFSSGFAEVGAEGEALQAELTRTAQRTGVRVIGPNCQGLVAFHRRLNLSFSSAFVEPGEPGGVGLVVQSGAVGGLLATVLRERGLGFSHWISSGNEADVDLAECLDFLARDATTSIIAAYAEGLRGGERLTEALRTARAATTPVVLLRAGRSAPSQRAAASHTGAAATAVTDAELRQAGAVVVRDVQELVDAVYAGARLRAGGRRLAILSNSGGLGVIMADACGDLGLELPALSPPTQQALRAFLPAFGAAGNPVDATAQVLSDASLLRRALETITASGEVDVVVVALCMINRMYPVDTIVRDLVEVSAATSTPVVVSWVASASEGERALHEAGLPVFPDPTRALVTARALAQMPGRGGASRPAR